VVDVEDGRSDRVGPSLKIPSMRPRAIPCDDETVSEPDLVVQPKSDGSRGVI
jgi:hypothetical protein